jgi:dephospho-CoA kinase
MRSVALTGNVAAGKSAVAARWSAAGVPVVSADQLARQAVAPGTPGLAAVVDAFGPEVLAADGSLDRAKVRAMVFANEARRTRLEEIVHPEVWRLRSEWLDQRRREGALLVVSEIPLLFETGREGDFDVVVLVDAPEEVRVERMVSDRGLAEEEARRIVAAQMPAAEKRARADHVIDNRGDMSALQHEAERVLAALRREAGWDVEGEAGDLMTLDLHLHTWGSWDCLSDPEAVLAAALARGYDRIAITDHNRLEVALRMAERHPERIIPGEEVKTAEGIDVIGLYLSREIPKGTPAEETIERIRAQGGIPYLPHPYAGGKGGGGKHAERLGSLCDVVEIFNARLHDRSMNDRARELADRLGKLRSAGSDAHTVGEVGNAFVRVPRHENRADALRAALAHSAIGGEEAPRRVHLASTWAKVRKKLPRTPGPGGR